MYYAAISTFARSMIPRRSTRASVLALTTSWSRSITRTATRRGRIRRRLFVMRGATFLRANFECSRTKTPLDSFAGPCLRSAFPEIRCHRSGGNVDVVDARSVAAQKLLPQSVVDLFEDTRHSREWVRKQAGRVGKVGLEHTIVKTQPSHAIEKAFALEPEAGKDLPAEVFRRIHG